ncbi:hypothetical protein [Microcoleus sp. B4-C1]|uniref:hypothetical protein n=1 Tax=Microcoleus sp. B4-C1 TaxID=2818660 RepID=UPI002FD58B81
MSRVSSKSGLSPSATRGSNAINLGKDSSGPEMGRKTQPSVTSGGIAITQEVGNIGGVSVTGGVSVEVSPIGIDVSGDPSYVDPSKASISIAGSAELPGGFLGIGGGVNINTNTGEIIGGSIGGEIGGLGINISASNEGDGGVEFTLQIPGTPIELSLGLQSPKKDPLPTPTPTPTIPSPSLNVGTRVPMGQLAGCQALQISLSSVVGGIEYISSPQIGGGGIVDKNAYWETSTSVSDEISDILIGDASIDGIYHYTGIQSKRNHNSAFFQANWRSRLIQTNYQLFYRRVAIPANPWLNPDSQALESLYSAIENAVWMLDGQAITIIDFDCSTNQNPATPPAGLPFPNPPPRRQIVDTCCQENLKFLREIYKKLGLARFPGQLPATIIQEVPNEGEEPAEPPQEPIPDLVSLLDWQFRRDDERWGQWEVQINVKDSDVTKEGDQGKQVKFPNLAESIAEIEGQMLSLTTNIDALIAITTKNLVESGLSRQEAIKGYLASK